MVSWTPEDERNYAMRTARQHNAQIIGETDELTRFAYPDGAPHDPEPQRAFQRGPVGAEAGKKVHPGRICICIKSFRVRSLDPDNLCPKYFIDCLRYAGLIPNDTAKDVFIPPIEQIPVKTKAEQRTEITILWNHKVTVTIEKE